MPWYVPLLSALIGTAVGGTIAWFAARQNGIFLRNEQIRLEVAFFTSALATELSYAKELLAKSISQSGGMSNVKVKDNLVISDWLSILSTNFSKIGMLDEDARLRYYKIYLELKNVIDEASKDEGGGFKNLSREKLKSVVEKINLPAA